MSTYFGALVEAGAARLFGAHVRARPINPAPRVMAGVAIVGEGDRPFVLLRCSSIAFARPKSSTFTVPSLYVAGFTFNDG